MSSYQSGTGVEKSQQAYAQGISPGNVGEPEPPRYIRMIYMKDSGPGDDKFNLDECFYGAVTVGERGQIVIPSAARTKLNIRAGDKLLVMRHPVYAGLVISRFEDLRVFHDEFFKSAQKVADSETGEDV